MTLPICILKERRLSNSNTKKEKSVNQVESLLFATNPASDRDRALAEK